MRFQQKQQMEREQKNKSKFSSGCSLDAIDVNENKLTASLGAGKVI